MGEEHQQRIQNTCLIIIAAVAIGFALYWLRPMMIPFTLALFAAFVLSLLVEALMKRFHFPRWAALTVSLLLTAAVFFLVANVVSVSVRELAANADDYEASIREVVDRGLDRMPWGRWGLNSREELERSLQVPVDAVGSWLLGTTNAIVDILSRSILVLIFTAFLLIGAPDRSSPKSGTWLEIEGKIKRYLGTKIIISAGTGIMVGLMLKLIGVDLAVAFGLMAFLLNFIPNLGSIIATLLPVPIVLVSPDSTLTMVILTFALPGAVQITVGNFVEPKIMGDSLEMHPVTILMALIFWGMLWGIVGMFLAVPITASIKLLLGKLEYTRAFAKLMEGRLIFSEDDFVDSE